MHNVSNACSAAAVGFAAGMGAAQVAESLSGAKPEAGRQEVLQAPGGFTVINDAYNANPDSMRASLSTFAALAVAGARIAVLGDMGELGSFAPQLHEEVGAFAAACGLDRLVCVGQLAQGIAAGAQKAGMPADRIALVADGAAVQGGVLTGDVSGILLLDVTPLSLGVETMGGVMTKMIDRNTTIPTSKTEVYSTAADNQTSVEINVLQCEREFARDNKSLGKFQLTGIPAARRGIPQIEVTFDIDANGIVKVTAKDKATGKSQQITISGSTALSDDEVDRMVKDAESHAEEDKKHKDEIEVRNQTDSLAYSAEQTLADLGDKVPADQKKEVEDAIAEAKKSLEGTDIDAIKAAGEKLTAASQKLAQVVYSATQDATAAGADAAPSDDDVVDADYEVVDDDKDNK